MKKIKCLYLLAGALAVYDTNATQESEFMKICDTPLQTDLVMSTSHAPDDYTVHYVNPCYRLHVDVENAINHLTVSDIDITNGSVVNFADGGPIGSLIRYASQHNAIPNPLGLTHSGLIINDSPRVIYNTVRQLMPDNPMHNEYGGHLSQAEGEIILRNLMDNHKEKISAVQYKAKPEPFVMEAVGTAEEVLRMIPPFVRISDFTSVLETYCGNVFVRTLNNGANHTQTTTFSQKYLGRQYEGLMTFIELIRAIKGENITESNDRLFCSEVVARFYIENGYAVQMLMGKQLLASNVIPEMFGSGAGSRYDPLY
ncbi:MAG: hypothetical protein LBB34_01945, partial [Holosporales bacterium]|nr:hypothetical protein [Holosporales bacterium]